MQNSIDLKKVIHITDVNDPAIKINFKPPITEPPTLPTTFNLADLFNQSQIELLVQKPEAKITLQTKIESDKHTKIRTLALKNSQSLRDHNIQLLHIGAAVVKFYDKQSKDVIFAPLVLVPAEIKADQSDYLFKIGAPLINEKAVALLKKHYPQFQAPVIKSEDTLFDCIKRTKKWNSANLGLKIEEPKNEACLQKIVYLDGAIISLFNPLGNYVAQKFKTLIDNNVDLDKIILKTEGNLFVIKQQKRINAELVKQSKEIWKVVETNLSQDKAILAALAGHTIIWGAPGTGKTQTLTNLIINILLRNKTALISSQKPIALEILYQRLQEANHFSLFLAKEHLKPQNFYAKMQDIYQKIVAIDLERSIKQIQPTGLLAPAEEAYLNNQAKNELNEQIESYKNKWQPEQWKWLEQQPQMIWSGSYGQFKKANQSTMTKTDWQKMLALFPQAADWKAIQADGQTIEKLENERTNLKLVYPSTKPILNDWKSIFTYKIHQIGAALEQAESQQKTSEELLNAQDISNFTFAIRDKTLSPLQFLKTHRKIIKLLFPIIMATPDVDLSIFANQELDYVIIDEASQMNVQTGQALLILGKTHILSGDEKQLQPMDFFKKSLESELALDNTPPSAIKSILDLGLSKNVTKIQLDKNYRAQVADLMTFNSTQFYENKLDVIDHFKYGVKNAVIVHHINSWNGQPIQYVDGVNPAEIHQIIVNLNDQVEKNPRKSIIVVTTNANQQSALERILLQSHPTLFAMMVEGQINIKNIANIQGEEADVVIFSVGYTKDVKFNFTFVGRNGGANALNVATSRAKEKLIVIKSLNAADVISEKMNEDLRIFQNWLQWLDLADHQKQTYRISNPLVDEVIDHNENFFTIRNKLIQRIEAILAADAQYKYLKCKSDHYIATLKADLVLLDELRQIPVCIFLINEDQTMINYLHKRDLAAFLKFKNYNHLVVSPEPDYQWLMHQLQPFLNEWKSEHEYVPPVLNHQKQTKNLNLNKLDSLVEMNEEHQDVVYFSPTISQNEVAPTRTKYKYVENQSEQPTNNQTNLPVVNEQYNALQTQPKRELIRQEFVNPPIQQAPVIADNRHQPTKPSEQKPSQTTKTPFWKKWLNQLQTSKKPSKKKVKTTPQPKETLIKVEPAPVNNNQSLAKMLQAAKNKRIYAQEQIVNGVKTEIILYSHEPSASVFWYINITKQQQNQPNVWMTINSRYFLTSQRLWYQLNNEIYTLFYKQLLKSAPDQEEAKQVLPNLKKYIIKSLWNTEKLSGNLPRILAFMTYNDLVQLLEDEKLHFEVIARPVQAMINHFHYTDFVQGILDQIINDKNLWSQSVFKSDQYQRMQLQVPQSSSFEQFANQLITFTNKQPTITTLQAFLAEFKAIRTIWQERFLV